MISTIKSLIKSLISPKIEYQEKVEDEDFKKDSMPPWGHSDMEYLVNNPPTYTGVPAPVVSPTDTWFEDPPRTEKQVDYMEREAEIKQENQGKEDPDIHQKMYEIATKNWTTVKETSGWQSGTGYGQFRVDT